MIVGALGAPGRATVDARGAVRVHGDAWVLDWWIGGDDRWHRAAAETAVRQQPVDGAPVLETRMRVPGGDAVQRVYGIGGPGDVVVVEVENASPAAFVVALVLRDATSIAVDGDRVVVDERVALVVPFPPPRWDVTDIELEPERCGVQTGPIAPTRLARGSLHAALLYPLSHRNRMRIGVVCGEELPRVDLAQAPDAAAAARGWGRQLDRAMRVRGPEELVASVDVARSQVLLDPEPAAATFAALEDWGFDEEAAAVWPALSGRERRVSRRRAELATDAGPAGHLLRVRDGLVRECEDGIELLREPPAPGVDLEVHGAPTRRGTVSFALRWHGPRPALLWEVADASGTVALRAPVLAPGWSTSDPTGETLLGT